jgi:hypothetical protein
MVEIRMKENNLYSKFDESVTIPDLILNKCPFGCNKKCDRNWANDTISHEIVCNCVCHQKKNNAADGIGKPDSAALRHHLLEVTNKSD